LTQLRTVRFGVIGCGLMGREFASAAGRWCHLTDVDVPPTNIRAPLPWHLPIQRYDRQVIRAARLRDHHGGRKGCEIHNSAFRHIVSHFLPIHNTKGRIVYAHVRCIPHAQYQP